MTAITGILTDYALMTEGVHQGRYAARIDDKPYPVQMHVDPFLLRLQKNQKVDVKTKNVDGEDWICKIERSKNQAKVAQGTPTDKPGVVDVAGDAVEKAEARVKANVAAVLAAKKAEQEAVARDPAINEKLERAGFDRGAEAAAKMKADAIEALRERVAQEETLKNVPATVSAKVERFDKDQINLIKATVARGCTDTEFELLMYLSAQYGLDPIRRQIWAVKYGTAPAAIFTGRDGFLEIAHRSGHFDGMESGVKTVREGDKDELIGWCKVYRKDMAHAFYVEVYEREYTTGKSLWQTKPRIMIQKVAESSCLRRAFSVSGLYCPEEMPEQSGA